MHLGLLVDCVARFHRLTAESCTGGLLASLITDISGATEWFKQGWVVYSNESKMRELGAEKTAFEEGESGAVSHEVAVQMVCGASTSLTQMLLFRLLGLLAQEGQQRVRNRKSDVAVVTEDYSVRRMDFGGNDRLDNKRSFAALLCDWDSRRWIESLVRMRKIKSECSNRYFGIGPLRRRVGGQPILERRQEDCSRGDIFSRSSITHRLGRLTLFSDLFLAIAS